MTRSRQYLYKTTQLSPFSMRGRFYIGVHKILGNRSPEKDAGFVGDTTTNTKIGRAIRKYGRECFKKRILRVGSPKDLAAEKKRLLVTKIGHPKCLNVMSHAASTTMSAEARMRHSQSQRRRHQREARAGMHKLQGGSRVTRSREKIAAAFGLPVESVVLVLPSGRPARPEAKIGRLRDLWRGR
jgi:hypothetical protein